MKLNNLIVTRYNTGYQVEVTVFTPVRAQFTDAMLTGQGHHRSLTRALLTACRDVLAQRRELNNLPA